MKNKNLKKFVSSILSAAMLTSATAVYMPYTANAEADIINCDFEDGLGVPWYSYETFPDKQKFEINDGQFINIVIISDVEDRMALQFKTFNLELIAGHEYLMKAKIKATSDCIISSVICDDEKNIYWDSLDVNDGKPYEIKKGEIFEFEQTVTLEETSSDYKWAFCYGTHDGYEPIKNGTVLFFDDILMRDLDENAVAPEPDEYGLVKPHSNVRVNQLGYLPNFTKRASYCTDNSSPCTFELIDSYGNSVYEGKSYKVVIDDTAGNYEDFETDLSGKFDEILVDYRDGKKDSGRYVHILDFSDFNDSGRYKIFVHDDVGVSDTDNGKYDTVADGDRLLWTNRVTKEQFVMNESAEFRIDNDIYDEHMAENALNYFYLNRSGIDIDAEHVVSSDNPLHARKAGHPTDTAYVQKRWINLYDDDETHDDGMYKGPVDRAYSIDVTGGWYNTDSYSKNVINGASAVWTLQNSYEFAKKFGYADYFAEGNLHFNSDNKNGVPDILDEARYELDWMMKMIVSEDDPYWGNDCAGMVYHGVKDTKWIDLATNPWDYDKKFGTDRVVLPPTYAATFDFAACAAQASRLWREFDEEYADKCLELAKNAYEAAYKNSVVWDVYEVKFDTFGYKYPYNVTAKNYFAPSFNYGGNCFSDKDVKDEAYWAACELYAATDERDYNDYLMSYFDGQLGTKAFEIPLKSKSSYFTDQFGVKQPEYTVTNGTLSLLLNPQVLTKQEFETIKTNITETADDLSDIMHSEQNGMGVPYTTTEIIEYSGIGPSTRVYAYLEKSNSIIINNALIMPYAYAVTGDVRYINYAAESMDYIFGRNGLDFSYVTGYGEHSVENVNHIYWGDPIDSAFPDAPDGVLASGANTATIDAISGILGIYRAKCAPQRTYVDNYESYTTNAAGLEINAPFAAMAAYLSGSSLKYYDENVPTKDSNDNPGNDSNDDPTYTFPVYDEKGNGDANCDDKVNMADAVLILQVIANPDKYYINGTDETHITAQGLKNADVNGGGVTNSDALDIQKFALHLIDKLPVE